LSILSGRLLLGKISDNIEREKSMLGSNVPTIGGFHAGFKWGDKWGCQCIQIYITLSRRCIYTTPLELISNSPPDGGLTRPAARAAFGVAPKPAKSPSFFGLGAREKFFN